MRWKSQCWYLTHALTRWFAVDKAHSRCAMSQQAGLDKVWRYQGTHSTLLWHSKELTQEQGRGIETLGSGSAREEPTTVCSFSPVKKYLIIPRAWKMFMTWNMWHFFTLFGSFWYLAFKVTNNKKFVKILSVCPDILHDEWKCSK